MRGDPAIGSLSVLFVDDNPADRLLAGRILGREFPGLQISHISDAAALHAALDLGHFDVAVTDYELRWGTGLDVLHDVKSRFPDRPVIMFAATGSQEVAVEAMKAGLDDYVLKSAEHFVRLPVAVRSVLERMEARRRVERAERRVTHLLEHFGLGVFRITPAGQLLESNRALFNLLDVPAEDPSPGPPLLARLGPWPPFPLPTLHTEDAAHRREIRFRRRDGRRAWLTVSERVDRASGEPVIEGLVEDVCDVRAAEQALRESEERFRTMADTAPVLLWIANAVGRCTFFNKPWLSFTGRGMEQEVGDGWMDGIHPEDRDRCAAIYREALRTEDRFSMEYRLRRADGVYRWVLHTGVPRFTPHGMPAGFIGSVLDVTPLKDLEIERTRLLANEQAARLDAEAANRAKDEFLAVLSHELRTPLNAMVGWLRLLRMGSLDSRKAQRALETIERNTYTQARLIDDLLDVSRIVTGKIKLELRSVDMGALVRATVDAMGPPAQDKGVELQAEVDPTIGAILGDQFRLQQVLGNLLSNAIKFTPVGGTVRVRLHRVESGVEMVVADTGKGIAPHLLPHVFDRFRQGDTTSTRAQGGLGLGLAIARHLVELHGGTIRADSAGADRGTTMLVSLPLPASALEPTGPGFTHPRYETLRLQPAELTGVHVLVVDDDVDACDLLSVVLQGWGAHVTTATSAAEAFALFGKERPDVVVSDIGMPDEDGYSLIRRLRATEPEDRRVPAIAVSALVSDEHRAHALAAGFDRHLPKPVQITDLLQVVSEFAPARSTMS